LRRARLGVKLDYVDVLDEILNSNWLAVALFAEDAGQY
jgi:hypothetical protein